MTVVVELPPEPERLTPEQVEAMFDTLLLILQQQTDRRLGARCADASDPPAVTPTAVKPDGSAP